MSKIPSITEQEFRRLNPRGLDKDFLSRLEACVNETFTELSTEESELENKLRAVRARAVQASMIASLQDAISDTPFAVDEKIVLFNKANQRKSADSKALGRSNVVRFNIAAAAAVAILGAFAALMIPGNPPASSSTASLSDTEVTPPASFIPTELPQTNFAPTSFERSLNDTSDQGVIWQNNTKAYRVLLHTFTDRITTANGKGETIQMEQPRIEFSLIPEEVD